MGLYTKGELTKKSLADLKDLLEEHDLEADDDWKKADYVDALLEVEEPEDDEIDDEVDDEVDDSDEEDDDPELPEEDEVDEVDDAPASKASKKRTKYTEGGKAENGEKLLGAKEVAVAIGTEAKTLRQFFRSGKSSFEAVGAGGRYEFKESDIEKIKAEFEGWKANKPGRGRTPGSGSTTTRGRKASKVAEIDTLDEVEEIEDLDDLEEIDDEDLELDD